MAAILDDSPVLAFDLDSDGHHPSYLQYLAQRWIAREVPRELVVVVAREFTELHPDVMALARPGRVRFDPIERPKLPWRLPGPLGPVANGILQWRALVQAARRHGAHHAVVMYIDQILQGALALRLPASCAISGIYFRPAFHYENFGQQQTPGERRRALRQRLTLRSALRHPRLHTLWTLDPYAVPHIRALGPSRVEALADPVPEDIPPKAVLSELTLRYGLGQKKTTTLLLFGGLTPRKGVTQALEATARVARGDGAKLTVLLVGRAPNHYQAALRGAVARAEAAGVTVVRDDSFVPEAHVQAYFQLADIVLAPYQRHVGSSGIAIRAARAGRPLLASSYGMLGESVRSEQLGVAVDATSVAALTDGLRQLLAETGATSKQKMASFAGRNTATAFADAIIEATR